MLHTKGTILVTGTNGGLGSAIVSKIVSSAEFSAFHGLYAVRNAELPTPSLDLALECTQRSLPHTYTKISLDLSKISSIREAAASINERVQAEAIPPITAIILNAGYQEYTEQTWTSEGIDMTFMANYLGHWILVLLLLQSIDREIGRIVWISSWSHYRKSRQNTINGAFRGQYETILSEHDLETIARGTWSATKDDTTGWVAGYRRYGASKLCCVLMIHELQRRLDQDPTLKNVSVLAVDPGGVSTGIARRSESWIVKFLLFPIIMPFLAFLLKGISPNGTFRTIEKSARDILNAALSSGPEPLTEHPKGLYLDGSEAGQYSEEAQDIKNGEMVWRASVHLAQLKDGDTALRNWK